jgi:hypothetical protein
MRWVESKSAYLGLARVLPKELLQYLPSSSFVSGSGYVRFGRSSLTVTQQYGYVPSKADSNAAHPSPAHSRPQILLSGCIILFNKHIFTTLNFPYVSIILMMMMVQRAKQPS